MPDTTDAYSRIHTSLVKTIYYTSILTFIGR